MGKIIRRDCITKDKAVLEACIIAILASFLLSTVTSAETNKFDKYNISFEIPSDWRLKEDYGSSSNGNATLYKADVVNGIIYSTYLTVGWTQTFWGLDPEYVLDLYMKSFNQDANVSDFQITDNKSIIVDGNKAASRVFNYKYGNEDHIGRYIGFTSPSSRRWIMFYSVPLAIFEDPVVFDRIANTFQDTTSQKP
jgi:hypothetical protein